MGGAISLIRQTYPGKPQFTEKDIGDLSGKVIIVTGANTGIGKELSRLLYSCNAKVYMMARSEIKTRRAIDDITSAVPKSNGELRLDVLFNNAGVGYPARGSKTKQGYELQLGVNCLGTFAFTKLLTPTLQSTAKLALPDTVRVVWVSSSAAEAVSPKGFMEGLPQIEEQNSFHKYCVSKLGGYLYGTEFAARYKATGVLSVPLNPGNLDSDFWRTRGPVLMWLLKNTVLYPTVFGAYTCLFAGFSTAITPSTSGTYVAPWGRLWYVSNDLSQASRKTTEGGSGLARSFWDWTENEVQRYL